MTYNPGLSSAFNDTKMRSEKISPCSGMCSLCTEDCAGTCEIGLSAVLGKSIVYPTNTGSNQVAGEKDYPIDYSHFNINGRAFGAIGCEPDSDKATIFNVGLSRTIGSRNPVQLTMPIILPALIKLNWKDYFAAAAMAGVCCVIGEGAPSKDPNLQLNAGGKIVQFEKLKEMHHAFSQYYRGYGQIALQCNLEDLNMGLDEYAITQCGMDAIEIKFGQAAKGTQPANRIASLKAALAMKKSGMIVYPDPEDPDVIQLCEKNANPEFWSYARLPMWTEETLSQRIELMRSFGVKNIYFKMAGFDRRDMEEVLRLAVIMDVDLVTFDGAGGGSGYSPSKMMNEWGLPAVCIESALTEICERMKAKGLSIPDIAITGGIASEDQVFKAIAIGAPHVKLVGLCRATMAAAMVGERVGKALASGSILKHFEPYGTSKETLFRHLSELKGIYGKEADQVSPGAIGAYSYLQKIAFGVQHFSALNRKFDICYVNQDDVIPMTRGAKEILKGTWFD
jgi:hypothetical protein